MVIGQNVKRRREQLNLSQEELARMAGTKQQSIQQLEAGIVEHPRYLSRLLKVLGCGYDELMAGDFYPAANGHALSLGEELGQYGKLTLRIDRDDESGHWRVIGSNISGLQDIAPAENLDSLLMLIALAIRDNRIITNKDTPPPN